MTCLRSHPCLLGPRAKLPTHTLPCAHWPLDTPGQLTRWAHRCPRRGTNMLSGGVCWLTSWLGSCRAGDMGIPVPLSYEDTGPGRLILAGGQTLCPQIPRCLSPLHPQPRQAREPQSSHHVSPMPCSAHPLSADNSPAQEQGHRVQDEQLSLKPRAPCVVGGHAGFVLLTCKHKWAQDAQRPKSSETHVTTTM